MPTGPALIEHMNRLIVAPGCLGIYGLGQMGVALRGPEGVVYIDPCLSDLIRERFGPAWSRAYPPPVEPGALTNAVAYLISHEHMDHLDPATVAPAVSASPGAAFISPGWCRAILVDECGLAPARLTVPEVLKPMTIPGTSARLTAIPSAHYDLERSDENGYRWLGYLIEWNGVTFYHAGDTIIYKGYVDTLKSLPAADVAIVPVNGRDWPRETVLGAIGNLHPAEAAWLTQQCGWDVCIPGHNDLYPENAIPNGAIVDAFSQARPRQKFKFLQPGELYYYVK